MAHHEHEHSDISVRYVGVFLAVLLVSMFVVYLLLIGYWRLMASGAEQRSGTSPFSGPRELAPQPRLQVAPQQDLHNYLEAEQRRLTTQGVDQRTGLGHMPIDKAMEAVLQRGLPSRPQEATNAPR
jgi:hypothetical protein